MKNSITLKIKRHLFRISPEEESNYGLYKSGIVAKFSDTTQGIMRCQKEKKKENK